MCTVITSTVAVFFRFRQLLNAARSAETFGALKLEEIMFRVMTILKWLLGFIICSCELIYDSKSVNSLESEQQKWKKYYTANFQLSAERWCFIFVRDQIELIYFHLSPSGRFLQALFSQKKVKIYWFAALQTKREVERIAGWEIVVLGRFNLDD